MFFTALIVTCLSFYSITFAYQHGEKSYSYMRASSYNEPNRREDRFHTFDGSYGYRYQYGDRNSNVQVSFTSTPTFRKQDYSYDQSFAPSNRHQYSVQKQPQNYATTTTSQLTSKSVPGYIPSTVTVSNVDTVPAYTNLAPSPVIHFEDAKQYSVGGHKHSTGTFKVPAAPIHVGQPKAKYLKYENPNDEYSFRDLYEYHPDTYRYAHPEKIVPLNVFGLPPKYRYQHPVGNVESSPPVVVHTNAYLPGPVVDTGVTKGSGHNEDGNKFHRLYDFHPDTYRYVNPEKNGPLNVFGLPPKYRYQSPYGNVDSFRPKEVPTNVYLAGPVVDVTLRRPNLSSSFSGRVPTTGNTYRGDYGSQSQINMQQTRFSNDYNDNKPVERYNTKGVEKSISSPLQRNQYYSYTNAVNNVNTPDNYGGQQQSTYSKQQLPPYSNQQKHETGIQQQTAYVGQQQPKYGGQQHSANSNQHQVSYGGQQQSTYRDQQLPLYSNQQKHETSIHQQTAYVGQQRPTYDGQQYSANSNQHQVSYGGQQQSSTYHNQQLPPYSNEQKHENGIQQQTAYVGQQRPTYDGQQHSAYSNRHQVSYGGQQQSTYRNQQLPSYSNEQKHETGIQQQTAYVGQQRPTYGGQQHSANSNQHQVSYGGQQHSAYSNQHQVSYGGQQQSVHAGQQHSSYGAQQQNVKFHNIPQRNYAQYSQGPIRDNNSKVVHQDAYPSQMTASKDHNYQQLPVNSQYQTMEKHNNPHHRTYQQYHSNHATYSYSKPDKSCKSIVGVEQLPNNNYRLDVRNWGDQQHMHGPLTNNYNNAEYQLNQFQGNSPQHDFSGKSSLSPTERSSDISQSYPKLVFNSRSGQLRPFHNVESYRPQVTRTLFYQRPPLDHSLITGSQMKEFRRYDRSLDDFFGKENGRIKYDTISRQDNFTNVKTEKTPTTTVKNELKNDTTVPTVTLDSLLSSNPESFLFYNPGQNDQLYLPSVMQPSYIDEQSRLNNRRYGYNNRGYYRRGYGDHGYGSNRGYGDDYDDDKPRSILSLLFPKLMKIGLGIGLSKELAFVTEQPKSDSYYGRGYSYSHPQPQKGFQLKLGLGPFFEKKVMF